MGGVGVAKLWSLSQHCNARSPRVLAQFRSKSLFRCSVVLSFHADFKRKVRVNHMFGRFNTFGTSPLLVGLRVATLLAVVLPVPGLAQATSGSQQVHVSRDSLAQLQSRLEETANSKAYSQALRDRARRESELLK